MDKRQLPIALAAVALIALFLVPVVYSEEPLVPARAKRVFTNDDFAPYVPEAPAKPVSQKKAEKAITPAAKPAASPEAERARKEVLDEMAATARMRLKAYDQSISEVQGKLEKEPSEFRRETYQSVLQNLRALRESNQKMLAQLEQGGAPGENK